jgi:hypothetical protein
VGETVAAIVAAEQHARATDPAARAALAEIAADEAFHAELAWRTVAWAVAAGGSEVLAAVDKAFEEALASGVGTAVSPGRTSRHMEAHGRLDEAIRAQVAASALAEVVAPCARALLKARWGDPTGPSPHGSGLRTEPRSS